MLSRRRFVFVSVSAGLFSSFPNSASAALQSSAPFISAIGNFASNVGANIVANHIYEYLNNIGEKNEESEEINMAIDAMTSAGFNDLSQSKVYKENSENVIIFTMKNAEKQTTCSGVINQNNFVKTIEGPTAAILDGTTNFARRTLNPKQTRALFLPTENIQSPGGDIYEGYKNKDIFFSEIGKITVSYPRGGLDPDYIDLLLQDRKTGKEMLTSRLEVDTGHFELRRGN